MQNVYASLAEAFPIEFHFAKKQRVVNSAVSKFLKCETVSEDTDRPLYYTCNMVRYRGEAYLAVTFSLFFELNPGYTVCCKTLGEHQGDVERVVVLFQDNKAKWAYFGAHGGGQGVWKECPSEGQLVVYVSPQSHAMYPSPGTYWRLFGFANDVCSGDGEVWKPDAACRCDARQQVWSETPYQVRRGINTPAHISQPTERSITSWERFALALPCVKKRVEAGEMLPTLAE